MTKIKKMEKGQEEKTKKKKVNTCENKTSP